MNGYYIRNKETGKLEIYFDKEDYMNLPDSDKQKIKSNFLFSRKSGAWISRCKFPNLCRPERVAKELGLENRGAEGEKLSFEEQQNRKAARAEDRAERYDTYSDNAEKRGESLQKPINDMHGDIAFFTQPNINSSAGRAFTNYRNKMFDAWERGFEEFKKSSYYAEKAEAARATAESASQPKDIAFCERRIAEAEKTIRAQKKNIEFYKERYNDAEDKEKVSEWIERAEEIIEDAISKSVYYHEWIEKLGGSKYSKDNIKPGYIVNLGRFKNEEVISTGAKKFKVKGCSASFLYSEITEVVSAVSAEEQGVKHPFKVGDKFVGEYYNYEEHRYCPVDVVVTKVTPCKVTVKVGDGRARCYTVNSFDGKSYYIPVNGLKSWPTKAI